MNKIKITATLSAIIITAASYGLANAATTAELNIQTTVDSVTEISTCGSVSFPSTFYANEGQITPPCTITAASNDPDGFYITFEGTSLTHTTAPGVVWDKLPTTSGGMDTACTSNCDEEWGFRIVNGTASEYDTVETDTDNELTAFDSNLTTCGTGSEPCWHTVDDVAETIISHANTGGAISRTANFDIEFGGVVSSWTQSGDYQADVTITIIAN